MSDVKRLGFIVLIFFVILLCQKEAEAVFSIELNSYSIDFGGMDMGSIKDDVPPIGLVVTCTTDQGNAWDLKIRNDQPLTHVSNPASMIPDTNFCWYVESTTGNISNLVYSLNERQDFTFEKTIYNDPGILGLSTTDITMKFELILPDLLQSGDYNSTVVFTFIEQ